MQLLCVSFVILATVSALSMSSTNRERKLWLFRPEPKIRHEMCIGGNSVDTGYCATRKECRKMGGKIIGTCSKSSAFCCRRTFNCSSSPEYVNVNGSLLVNPTANSSPRICEYKLLRPKMVWQVRLSFRTFNISRGTNQLDSDGACTEDELVIGASANANSLGPLCGDLTGQTLYLDYGSSSEISLLIILLLHVYQRWEVTVTFIKCDSREKAPQGCLQYFTSSVGTVTSFNWKNGNYDNHLNDLDYSICVETQPGMNKITWRPCDPSTFLLTGTAPIDGVPGSYVPGRGSDCTTDWFMILGVDKFCGNFFGDPVTASVQPFVVNVHFNEDEVASQDFGNIGFCMMWSQSP